MAWGYWSATSVSDRGRSPRRDRDKQSNVPATVSLHYQQAPGNNLLHHQSQQQQYQQQELQQQLQQTAQPEPAQQQQQPPQAAPSVAELVTVHTEQQQQQQTTHPAQASTAGVSLSAAEPIQGGSGHQVHQIQAELAAATADPGQELPPGGGRSAPASAGPTSLGPEQLGSGFYPYATLTRSRAESLPTGGIQVLPRVSAGSYPPPSPVESDSVDYEMPGSSVLNSCFTVHHHHHHEEPREHHLSHASSRMRLLRDDDDLIEGLSDVEFEDVLSSSEFAGPYPPRYSHQPQQPSYQHGPPGGGCLVHGIPACRLPPDPSPPLPPTLAAEEHTPAGDTQVWLDDISWVFPNVPPAPGMPCQGEDRSIYRRGARRWRKLYRVNGHIFQAKRFNRRAFCAFCQDRIWGLGRQGFKCIQCKLLVHKKCHKLVRKPCISQQQPSSSASDPQASERNGEQTQPDSPHSSPAGHHDDDSVEAAAAEDACRHRSSRRDRHQQQQQQREQREQERQEGAIAGAGEAEGEELALDDIAGAEGAGDRQYSLSDFELIRVIGRGSYAKVLMVELKATRRIYAMKVIKKALVTDDEDIDWVQTEKHVFETASNHPFLVGLHSCFQTPSRLFFVIEFVRGGDLMFHMQRQRRLPEEHARFYAAEISLALDFLHTKGIIYRDLKLDNVLLDHEGHVKLTDYGMCKEGVRDGDTTATFCGTPNYIAPEILRGEDYGFSVDWWALGVLLYEMLAGRSPFDIAGASENPDQNTEDYLFQVILQKTIRIPRSLSVKAASVLKGFLCKEPAERLGCGNRSGVNAFHEIMNHSFFKAIDWELLEQKQVTPPYKPRLDSDRDLANFPPEFTDEPVHLTPDDPRVIDRIDQSEFEGFEYVNPLLMSLEDCV